MSVDAGLELVFLLLESSSPSFGICSSDLFLLLQQALVCGDEAVKLEEVGQRGFSRAKGSNAPSPTAPVPLE